MSTHPSTLGTLDSAPFTPVTSSGSPYPTAQSASSTPRKTPRRFATGEARAPGVLEQVVLPLFTTALVLGLWEVLVRIYHVPPTLLPAPSVIWSRLLETFPTLAQHAVPTTVETVLSFLLATLGGVVLAIMLTYSRLLNSAIYPGVVFFQLIPKIALAPLFVVWMGIGSQARLAFAVFIAFFPIVVATMAGLRTTPPDMLRLCRGLTATSWQVFAHVRLPYAVPHIFSGMKIAVTFPMIGVIVAEFISAQEGLGYLIVFASSQADTPLILAAVLVLCIIGLALYGFVVGAERLANHIYGAR